MPWEHVAIHSPALAGEWLNVESPPTMDELLAGGALLLDFWEYSCINCLRTLPYLEAWYERYHALGLQVVGIHTPEFAFGRARAAVEAEVQRLGLPYPILLDPTQALWQTFAIRAWPTKQLIDGDGLIRYRAQGEGHYQETEAAIQQLLRERQGEALRLPPLLAPLRPTDASGAICYRPTPELHAGGPPAPVTHFPHPTLRPEGQLYFEGAWRIEHEYAESLESGAALYVPYRAAEINAVLASGSDEPLPITLIHDGLPLTLGEAGADVIVDSEWGSYLRVRAPRLYHLASNPDAAPHELRLEALEPGVRVYAFSFVACPKAHYEAGDLRIP